MKYAIGLDNGGTVTKAALFDELGNEKAVYSQQTKVITPMPDFTERDMEELWQANYACIRKVMEMSSVAPEDVVGVAVCGHGKGAYLWGKDGKPAYNGIISTDRRAWRYPEKWKQNGVLDEVYPLICQQILPSQQVALMAWFKEHNPEVYNNIQYIFSVKDYIRFRLTGEAYSEATDISGSGLINLNTVERDMRILEAFGIPEVYDAIAPIRYSYEKCGTITEEAAQLTGLKAGTLVAGGMFDIDACAIAMAVTEPEQLCSITGTWSINEFIAKKPVLNTAIAMNSLYAMEGYYLIEESSPSSAGNLEWIIKNILPVEELKKEGKLYDVISRMIEQIDPAESDVYFTPFLYGSNRHPAARASFVGMTNYHTTGHMLRAVYEGVAFSHKTHIDKLLSVRQPPKAIRLAGGAVNSPVWVQIFADVLGFDMETVRGVSELGALGCAMAVFVANGVYKDYAQAAQKMVRVDEPVHFNRQAHEIYEKKYRKYTQICDALEPIWNDFALE